MERINDIRKNGYKAGQKLKVTYDPAFSAKYKREENLDPWYMQIECVFGVIYPYSPSEWACEVDGHPRVVGILRGLLGSNSVYQDGEGEVTFVFGQDRLDAVFEVIRPKRQRQWTEAERAQARERYMALFGPGSEQIGI